MAYTPSPLRTRNNLSFGSFPEDQNRVNMPLNANFTISQDATGTPVTSPQTNVSGSGATLTVPPNAVSLTINPTVTTQIGEDSSYAQGLNIPANAPFIYPCARQQYIYIKPSSGTNTVSFQFNCI